MIQIDLLFATLAGFAIGFWLGSVMKKQQDSLSRMYDFLTELKTQNTISKELTPTEKQFMFNLSNKLSSLDKKPDKKQPASVVMRLKTPDEIRKQKDKKAETLFMEDFLNRHSSAGERII